MVLKRRNSFTRRSIQIFMGFTLGVVFMWSLFLFSFPAPSTAEKETIKFPGTPAGKRLKEVVTLFNEGSRQKWKDYITKSFTKEFLDMVPIDEHLEVFSETCDKYERFELKWIDKEKSTEFQLRTVLWAPSIESWMNLRLKVEEKPPHKIAGAGIGPGEPPPGMASTAKMTDREIVEELRRYLKIITDADKFSGTVLLAKNGEILFKGAYGLASKRFNVPNRIDTKFNLGSMNKMFTSIAVAQLVEKGKLSYDDLVGKYLGSDWVTKETAEKVKIKHLLTHTCGLGGLFHQKFWDSSRLRFRELDDWKELLKDEKPKFEPGTKWSYSNSGMFILGPIIEKASGQGYYDYIHENLYKPAGMINSDCYDMDRPVPNLAIGYYKKYTDDGADWRNNLFLHSVKGGPAGGGFSTVEDLFNYARALMGNKLVSKETVELLTTAKPEHNSPTYGYGFGITKTGNETVVGHSGGFSGISSTLRIYKKSGYVYAVMSNYSGGMFLVHSKLTELLNPHIK